MTAYRVFFPGKEVLDLVSSVLIQEIGCEERLKNDLFCVERAVKP